jgi:hypothetical protein
MSSGANTNENKDKKKKNNQQNSNYNKINNAKIDLRSGVPRLVVQNRNKLENTSSVAGHKSEKKPVNTHVTISDIMSKKSSRNFLIYSS